MTTLTFIVVLLIVLILLLCERQEARWRTLGYLIAMGAVSLAAYYIVPILLGLVAVAVSAVWRFVVVAITTMLRHPRWAFYILGSIFPLTMAIVFVRLGWLDIKDNRAIKNGSIEAFNKRVEQYITIFNYSPEKAIEVTTKIRDGK